MMRTIFLSTLMILGLLARSQKVLIDNKDKFTGNRSIATTLVKVLGKSIQAQGTALMTPKDTIYTISFVTPSVIVVSSETSTADTTNKICQLMTAEGKIISGKWLSSTDAYLIGTGNYQASGYQFSKADLVALRDTKVTDIKMIGGKGHGFLTEIPKNNQESLMSLAKLLLSL